MPISALEICAKYHANRNSVSEALIPLKPIGKEVTSANRRPCLLYDEHAAASALIDLYVRRHDKYAREAEKWMKLAEEAAIIRGRIQDED